MNKDLYNTFDIDDMRGAFRTICSYIENKDLDVSSIRLYCKLLDKIEYELNNMDGDSKYYFEIISNDDN